MNSWICNLVLFFGLFVFRLLQRMGLHLMQPHVSPHQEMPQVLPKKVMWIKSLLWLSKAYIIQQAITMDTITKVLFLRVLIQCTFVLQRELAFNSIKHACM